MIVIHPFAQKLRNGQVNPKTFPYWKSLLQLLGEKEVIQLGVEGEDRIVDKGNFKKNLPLREITKLLKECNYWISIDSFLPHLAHHIPKPGVVLWSASNPQIYGYPENLNLLKNESYLRHDQFGMWEALKFNADAFMKPEDIAARIKGWLPSTPHYRNAHFSKPEKD